MRLLKIVVIAMGVLIALGVGVIVYTLIERGSKRWAEAPAAPAPAEAPAQAPAGAPAAFGERALGLPAGSRVQQIELAQGRLVISVLVPEAGERLVVIDLESGRPLGTIALEAAP